MSLKANARGAAHAAKALARRVLDVLASPLVLLSAWLLRAVRARGFRALPACAAALRAMGVCPVRRHYYEPFLDERDLWRPLDADRDLPAIDWNEKQQLELLETLIYGQELGGEVVPVGEGLEFRFHNTFFNCCDAQYWYNFLRRIKPKRIIEIGSGNSTLLAAKAISANRTENPAYSCEHTCIEPYEAPYLERLGVRVVRERVEKVGLDIFRELAIDDVLFIDSSHVIRPQGDVLFIYLSLLPRLRKGVVVHAHDIFSPQDYSRGWLLKDVRFWNEQYLLEVLLSYGRDWKIIGALFYLATHHRAKLLEKCPYLDDDPRPGSFYMQKLGAWPQTQSIPAAPLRIR